MWLETLKERAHGLSPRIISERTKGHLPERTVDRILSGETAAPRIDTIIEIGAALGLTPQEIFADTNFVVATESLAEAKEAAEEAAVAVEAEKDLAVAEMEMLRAKAAAQETEIALLKAKLQHKEELLAVYNYFTKIKTGE